MPYDNTNTGVLFRNDKHAKETDPTHKGQANVDGQDWWVSAWVNEVKEGERKGQRYFKLAFSPKGEPGGQQRAPQQSRQRAQAEPQTPDFEDIPF